jgi:hypothetical protein
MIPRVLLATSVDPTCGIAEHSRQLMRHTPVSIDAYAEALDPAWTLEYLRVVDPPGILHLNYHRGLHSRWTGPALQAVRTQVPQLRVVVTWHDTYERHDPDDPLWQVASVADHVVVHEPCDLLELRPGRTSYWRQGVPDPASPAALRMHSLYPILGLFGHDFPWKNFEPICRIAAECGWGVCHVGPRLAPAREEALRIAADQRFETWPDQDSRTAVSVLAACDASAFLYTCANSGTSGAIRWGIAAGKPVFAQRGCRQFRDLQALDMIEPDRANPLPIPTGITWTTLETFADDLAWLGPAGTWDSRIVRLRTQESWRHLGQRYAALYQRLVDGEAEATEAADAGADAGASQ